MAAVALADPGGALARKRGPRTPIAQKLVASAPADDASPKAVGTPGSRITMEIFSDFQCPACKQLHLNVVRRLLDDYVYAGKVYLIYRDLPLPSHAYSRLAARYANAAREIGRYDEVADALFRNQEVWAKTGQIEPLLAAVLTKAEMKKLQELVRKPAIDADIDSDVRLAQQYRVQVTPTMRITARGKVNSIPGVVQYEVLRNFLDSLLE